MGKTVALPPAALARVRDDFARYYASADVPPPPRFPRREFAAFPFSEETLMRRHASFHRSEELQAFLRREAPRHVYYSSAYYRQPEHPKMDGKGWLGSDLIFDLDADHLRKADELDYASQLRRVKQKLELLLDDFLFGDFGIDPGETSIVFSGSRGYHVHVREEPFVALSSGERRELVEYVLGLGFDPRTAVEGRRARGRRGPDGADAARTVPSQPFKSLPSPDSPGWRGRTTRAVLRLLRRWQEEGSAATTRELEAMGVAPRRAAHWARKLIDDGKARQIVESLSLEVFAREVPEEFLSVVLRHAAIELQGETDAPVTTDVHRLIRLPGSLHGGTGLRVVPLDRDALDGFDPFADAARSADGTGHLVIEFTADVDYPFRPEPLRGRAGGRTELPTPLAEFALLRGEAVLPPSPG